MNAAKSPDTIPIPPYPGEFLHGFSLLDFFPCWNLSLDGRLRASEFVRLIQSGFTESEDSPRSVPMDSLRRGFPNLGFCTPRAGMYVAVAAMIRAGLEVGYGIENTRWMLNKEKDRILRISEIELAFEDIRRRYSPRSASRLCCLWVAESTEKGELHIRDMLGESVFLLKVHIEAAARGAFHTDRLHFRDISQLSQETLYGTVVDVLVYSGLYLAFAHLYLCSKEHSNRGIS